MTFGTPPDIETDIVDVPFRPLVRALGNLVIAFAQAEACLLEFVAEQNGGDELAAVETLRCAKEEKVLALVQELGLEGYELDEMQHAVKGHWRDKEIRNRMMHDDWFPFFDGGAAVGTRGFTRKKAEEVFNEFTTADVWCLARRFRQYGSLFSHRADMIRRARPESVEAYDT